MKLRCARQQHNHSAVRAMTLPSRKEEVIWRLAGLGEFSAPHSTSMTNGTIRARKKHSSPRLRSLNHPGDRPKYRCRHDGAMFSLFRHLCGEEHEYSLCFVRTWGVQQTTCGVLAFHRKTTSYSSTPYLSLTSDLTK